MTVLLPNVPEFPIAALGIIKGGLLCTTVNPIYTPGKYKNLVLINNLQNLIMLFKHNYIYTGC